MLPKDVKAKRPGDCFPFSPKKERVLSTLRETRWLMREGSEEKATCRMGELVVCWFADIGGGTLEIFKGVIRREAKG